MKILNLYANIGGNRFLWGENHEITSVEINPKRAAIYKALFPNDKLIIGDAHEYLRQNFKRFDFIWSSPPCPTHSLLNTTIVGKGKRPKYAEMTLYQEVIFLKSWFKGVYCVENVIPYYTPLIAAQKCDRHLFWCNFKIANLNLSESKPKHESATVKTLLKYYGLSTELFKEFSGYETRHILRDMVTPETGRYILERAQGIYNQKNTEQINLF
jgi:DNA (cytosine-5)-methyltransferase 1